MANFSVFTGIGNEEGVEAQNWARIPRCKKL